MLGCSSVWLLRMMKVTAFMQFVVSTLFMSLILQRWGKLIRVKQNRAPEPQFKCVLSLKKINSHCVSYRHLCSHHWCLLPCLWHVGNYTCLLLRTVCISQCFSIFEAQFIVIILGRYVIIYVGVFSTCGQSFHILQCFCSSVYFEYTTVSVVLFILQTVGKDMWMCEGQKGNG